MTSKRCKITFLLLTLCAIAGTVFLYYRHRTSGIAEDRVQALRRKYPAPRHEIRGFEFDGHYEGKKIISIKADRFGIEKKKLGFFRFGLMNEARIENAVVDIYGKTIHNVEAAANTNIRNEQEPLSSSQSPALSPDKPRLRQTVTFEGLFSKSALPPLPVKRVSSIIIEPVSVRLHDQTSLVCQISAAGAAVRLNTQDILFRGDVKVVSSLRVLTTDQLTVDPQNALLTTNRHFVLRTPEKQIEGEGLTTDVYLSCQ